MYLFLPISGSEAPQKELPAPVLGNESFGGNGVTYGEKIQIYINIVNK